MRRGGVERGEVLLGEICQGMDFVFYELREKRMVVVFSSMVKGVVPDAEG